MNPEKTPNPTTITVLAAVVALTNSRQSRSLQTSTRLCELLYSNITGGPQALTFVVIVVTIN